MQPVETPRVYSGRYEATHMVARGGMAQVYRAMDLQLDRPVALKVLFPELSVDRNFVERFKREAQAAANLSHPNIVPVFDWGEDDGAYFIVMEYVDGRPLSAVLRDPEPLAPRQIATIGAGVAAALAFAHRHGVVHRDVKPGNVLITPEGDVKVTDFGIARAVNTEESLTQTGAVMGTAAYFSPEQAEGKGVDARSDIYSLGVVLYEMAAGRPPFSGDSPVAVASKHVRDHPLLPHQINATVPPALEAVVMKAMAKNPEDRYAHAEELRADLLRFADGRPVEAADATVTSVVAVTDGPTTMLVADPPPRTGVVPIARPAQLGQKEEEERKKRTRRLVVALVVLLAALGVIAFFLVRSLGGNVTVPDVAGQSASHAAQVLQNDNLTVGAPRYVASTTVPKGIVVATDPRSGTSVTKNSTVHLVVSAGPLVTVPNVQGQSFSQAVQLLSAEGLDYTVKYVASNKPVGTVLAQDPGPDQRVLSTTKVQLTVSSNQTSVSVPSVLGQTPSAAGSILGKAGLNVGNQSSGCSGLYPSGQVQSQSRAPNSIAPPNASIDIVVSNCVTVPGVLGASAGAAQATLGNAGLTASTTTDTTCANGATPGTVDTQNPGGSALVPPGSAISISVCQSASTTTTGSTSTTTSTTPSTGTSQPKGGGGGGGGGGGSP